MSSPYRRKSFKALVIFGLLYRNCPSKPGLDIAKILSYFFEKVVVISPFSFTYKSLALSICHWLLREVLVLFETLKNRGHVKLIVIHQMVTLSGCLMGKALGAKIVVYVGGSIYEGLYQRGFAKIVAIASIILWKVQLRLADMVVVPSSKLISLSKLTEYIGKVRVAPTRFITTKLFKKGNNHFGKAYNKNVIIGYIGRFESEKGVEVIPKVIHLTVKVKNLNNLRWILVGDGSLREKVENEIKKMGLLNFVHFTGWVEKPESYLTKMQLLLLPSRSEGIPNVILEAMACGTPVLTTPVGGIPDVIRDGETGFLLKSDDPEHIANKIIEVLSKPQLLEKVSKNAYKYVLENFSCEKVLMIWSKILNELKLSKIFNHV